ncbi:MAG: hypothetical protein ACOVSW_12710, partial [Candidatus Kapaibacteriota bacterium]
DTFNGGIPNGTVLGPTHYTVTGLPPGITPVITKVSPTQVTVTFTGTANPVPSGAFNNIQVSFLPAALTGGDPSVIQGLNGQNLGINFPIATPPTISITGFSPTSGYRGVSVLISGTGFTNASSVRFGNFPAQSFQVLNDSWIRAVVDTTDGNTVQVTSPLGTAQRISFTYFLPTTPRQGTVVTGISPSQFTFGTPVTLSGINFNGATQVLIGGVPVQSFTVNSDGQITAIVGGVPVNDQIQVFTNNPALASVPTNFSGFGAQYMRGQPPTLLSVSPNPIRSSGEDIPLALTGINLSPDGRISVQDGTKPPVLVAGSATTPTQATMTLPAALRFPGTQRIIFTNPDTATLRTNPQQTICRKMQR